MSGYEAYTTYLALKRHFTTEYDYFKYNGKIKSSEDSFAKRRDKYSFEKLERKHKQHLLDYLVANLSKDPKVWVGNLSDEVYTTWKKEGMGIEHFFKEDLNKIAEYLNEHNLQFNDLFKAENNAHPILLKMQLTGYIRINSMCALEVVIKYLDYWTRKYYDDNVVLSEVQKLKKYLCFLSLDRPKFLLLVQENLLTKLNK